MTTQDSVFQSYPPTWTEPRDRRSAEKQVFLALHDQCSHLPLTLLHSTAFLTHNRKPIRFPYHQLDLLLIHPDHGLLSIEVKGGANLRIDRGQWFIIGHDGKEYRLNLPPQEQANDAIRELHRELAQAIPGLPTAAKCVAYAVCFPGMTIDRDLGLSLPRDLILDQADLETLPARLDRIWNHWAGRKGMTSSPGWFTKWIDPVVDTLMPQRLLLEMLGPTLHTETARITRLSIEQIGVLLIGFNAPAFKVAGCAGSGKTTLALGLARKWAKEGRDVVLVCFNTALSYWLKSMVYDLPNIQIQTMTSFLNHPHALRWKNGLVVDEAQDAPPAFWERVTLYRETTHDGQLAVFYDDNQHVG